MSGGKSCKRGHQLLWTSSACSEMRLITGHHLGVEAGTACTTWSDEDIGSMVLKYCRNNNQHAETVSNELLTLCWDLQGSFIFMTFRCPRGKLLRHIFSKASVYTWRMRIKIIWLKCITSYVVWYNMYTCAVPFIYRWGQIPRCF